MAFNNPTNAKNSGFQSITTGGVWNGRTITAGANINVSNGDGISANPVISATSSGGIIQQVRNRSTTAIASTSTLAAPSTTPNTGNTDAVISVSLTPSDSSNILVIQFACPFWAGNTTGSYFLVFQDGTFKSGITLCPNANNEFNNASLLDYITAGTTSSTTIQIRCASSTGDLFLLENDSSTHIFGATGSAIALVVTEMSP